MGFRLDISASDAINRIFAQSNCVEPVAVLSMRTQVFNSSNELRSALGSDDKQKIRDAAEQEWSQSSVKARFVLDVFAYEKAEINSTDVVLIDGIAFELPQSLNVLLQDACLYFENGFLLRSRDGTKIDLPVPR